VSDFDKQRVWDVNISDIEITNLTSHVLNPFLRFTIGGTYCIETLVLGDGKKQYLQKGTSGPQKISDKVSYLESNKSKLFRMQLHTEVKLSYN
jgi:hypothetical protein